MKAITTRYAGCKFRSRLEARYAVLFKSLKIEWEYEPEGFELDDGSRYLPDFFVRMRTDHPTRQKYPAAGYWVEIKGVAPSEDEIEKMRLLCMGSKHHGYIFFGPPRIGGCNAIRISNNGKVSANCSALLFTAVVGECVPNEDFDLQRAVFAARSAQFEFYKKWAA